MSLEIGPQVLVQVSIYQGKPFWAPIFDPLPCGLGLNRVPKQVVGGTCSHKILVQS